MPASPKRDTLSKSERLSSERRIEALFAGGRRGGVGPLRFCWVARAADGADFRDSAGDAAVSVLFTVPKKVYKRAWKRNLMKRRMRESYRRRKHELLEAALSLGRRVDIALVCVPEGAGKGKGKVNTAAKAPSTLSTKKGGAKRPQEAPLPDFNTIDNAIEKILDQIASRLRR